MKHNIKIFIKIVPVSLYWMIGFLLGIPALLSNYSQTPFYYGAFFTQPSLFGIVFSSLLPVLLVTILGYYQQHNILRIILILNGYTHCFCSLYFCLAFSQGGWFVSFFTMFSQSCCSALSVLLSSLVSQRKKHFNKEIYLYFIVASALVCIMDYFIISNL